MLVGGGGGGTDTFLTYSTVQKSQAGKTAWVFSTLPPTRHLFKDLFSLKHKAFFIPESELRWVITRLEDWYKAVLLAPSRPVVWVTVLGSVMNHSCNWKPALDANWQAWGGRGKETGRTILDAAWGKGVGRKAFHWASGVGGTERLLCREKWFRDGKK